MSNTLIGLTNLITTATTLKNGTGGSAPPLEQTSPFTMANAQNSDRYTLWETVNPPSVAPVVVDYDLGSNQTVTAAAVLGVRPTSGLFTSVKIWSASAATGYPPSIPTTFTLQATLNSSGRDLGATFASVNHRYWRFEFNHVGTTFFVGRLWLGNPTDLGGVHYPGGKYSPFRNRREPAMPNGAPVLLDLGDPGADFTLPWQSITTAAKDVLLTLQTATGSFLMIDPDGNFFEVFARGGKVSVARQFVTNYNANIELSRLA